MIVLRGVRFESHANITWRDHRAGLGRLYFQQGRVVGISKLARVVDVYAKRLQIQEKMTRRSPTRSTTCCSRKASASSSRQGITAMTTRGVYKPDTDLVTSRMLGAFRDNALTRQELLGLAKHGPLSARVFWADGADGQITSLHIACAQRCREMRWTQIACDRRARAMRTANLTQLAPRNCVTM